MIASAVPLLIFKALRRVSEGKVQNGAFFNSFTENDLSVLMPIEGADGFS